MENLENNTNEILDQEDDGKTFAGGALFGDDVEGADSEDQAVEVIAEDPVVDKILEEKPSIKKDNKPKKTEAKKEEPKVEEPELSEEVPLFSSANLFKFGLGELKKGYNIIKREEAEQWLKHRKVRLATARELARYYGKE
jgi:hypothetical protein